MVELAVALFEVDHLEILFYFTLHEGVTENELGPVFALEEGEAVLAVF